MDYRTEQLLNVKISQPYNGGYYSLKITSLKDETKWLNISPSELDKIFNILKEK